MVAPCDNLSAPKLIKKSITWIIKKEGDLFSKISFDQRNKALIQNIAIELFWCIWRKNQTPITNNSSLILYYNAIIACIFGWIFLWIISLKIDVDRSKYSFDVRSIHMDILI